MDKNSLKEEALHYHAAGRPGKIEVIPTTQTANQRDLSLAYSPGVAEPCLAIHQDTSDVYRYTAKGNLVAVISNGTAVLGLGDIGPEASKPVMEGKGLLFKIYADIDCFDLELDTKNVDDFIKTVKILEPTFGGVNLEDISAPDCFEIEERLKEELNIPVMHDDQDGTAVVCLAAVINACRIVKGNLEKVQIGQVGLGAAGSAIARLIMAYTKRPVLCCDNNPAAIDRVEEFRQNKATLEEIMKRCDVVISTTGVEGLIDPTMVKSQQIILALTNPVPEITEEEALKAGAAFYSDGRYVNNLLAYPGIFKGALETRATAINDAMLLAAVQAIVDATPKGEIVPSPLGSAVHKSVTKAVAKAAMKSGIAQKELDDEYFDVDEKA